MRYAHGTRIVVVYTRPPRTHHWQWSISTIVAQRFVFRRRRNMCQVFVANGWQLTSRRHLLPIAYQPGASYVDRKKSLGSTMSTAILTCHDATAWRLQTTLRTVPISHQVLPAICNRHRYEASRHFLATNTWHQFLPRQDKHHRATVGQMLKYQWWMGGGLLCTVYVRIKFMTSECLVLHFVKLLCIYTHVQSHESSETARVPIKDPPNTVREQQSSQSIYFTHNELRFCWIDPKQNFQPIKPTRFQPW